MNSSSTILIVEDEPKVAHLLQDYLHHEGLQTHWINNGLEVADHVKRYTPDVMLLDVMLPGKNGTEVCKEVRAFSAIPIIMVTARVDEIDRLLGLELGADDYVCKPFSPREVVARVKAQLRRQRLSNTPHRPRGLYLDCERHEARFNEVALDLTPVEFRLLHLLSQHAGKVYSRQQLLDYVYEDHRIVTDRTVDTHIKNLRRKLQSVSPDAEFIQSVYGVGYKFVDE